MSMPAEDLHVHSGGPLQVVLSSQLVRKSVVIPCIRALPEVRTCLGELPCMDSLHDLRENWERASRGYDFANVGLEVMIFRRLTTTRDFERR